MPVAYASPGVYIEEIQNVVRPIQAIGTSLTAFIGITEEAKMRKTGSQGANGTAESLVNKATLVANWTQFTRSFGGFANGAYLPDAVYNHFTNGGGPCYIVSLRALKDSDNDTVAASVNVPAKGKGDAFTVSHNLPGDNGNNLIVTIRNEVDDKGKETGAFTMTAGNETKSGLTLKKGTNYLGDTAFEAFTVSNIGSGNPADGTYQLAGGGIRPLKVEDFIGDTFNRTGLAGLEAIDEIRLIACPDLMAGYDGSETAKARIKAVQQALISHCERMRYRFAILDTPPGLRPKEAKDWRDYLGFDSSFAALYYPWVEVADLVNGGTKRVPPSGHLTGVYNRVDGDRGAHKAPANEIVMGATGVEIQISRGEQDILNPVGVNCIRTFPGRGIRVWGARTLSSDGAWRYVSVRRLFIMVSASMDIGLQWVVFEPNDSRLWARIRRDVTGFLRNVWRSGALFGDTEAQAFYVKCDEELNSEEVRDLGQLIIEVGMAPVKPAEFVIFRLSQWSYLSSGEGGE